MYKSPRNALLPVAALMLSETSTLLTVPISVTEICRAMPVDVSSGIEMPTDCE